MAITAEIKTAETTYLRLLRCNRDYRLFMLSFFAAMSGEWFNYVASISLIERLVPNSNLALSMFLLLRFIPRIIFTFFGGAIADSFDKRYSLIILNVISFLIAVQFMFAVYSKSMIYLYILSFLQQCFGAMYEPIENSFIPMLVQNDEDLKKATSLLVIVYSVMAALGAGIGGVVSAYFGLQACFLLDSFSYVVSTIFLYMIGGIWKAGKEENNENSFSSIVHAEENDDQSQPKKYSQYSVFLQINECFDYLRTTYFAPILLMKATSALIGGSGDILNVAFSKVPSNELMSSMRLGILLSCDGLGCLIGPLLIEQFTSMKNLRTVQQAVIFSYVLIALSCIGMGFFAYHFWIICLLNILFTSGAATVWVNSTLLVQKFSRIDMLGRVTSIESTFSTLCEALSAIFAGASQDFLGLSPTSLCFALFSVCCTMILGWYIFDQNGGGAALLCAKIDDEKNNECAPLIS